MKRIIQLSLFLVIPAMIFSACKKKTLKHWNVKNMASGTINISSSSFRDDALNITIDSGNTKTFIVMPDDGDNNKVETNPATNIKYLIIKNAGGSDCTKDYKDSTKWIIDVKKTKNSGANYEHNYTFEVTNADF